MKIYVVINEIDNEEMAEFKTLKQANDFITNCKRFDKEQDNPFNESYLIVIRES